MMDQVEDRCVIVHGSLLQEVRAAAAPLLRGFQAEIDAAAKRTKAADSAFLAVYKRLIHMPGLWLVT